MRLSAASLGSLPAWVQQPGYERATPDRRIVHMGIGAFHRAHQAVYTDDAMAADRNWGITGVSLRSQRVRDALQPQDNLYFVLAKGERDQLRLVGAIDRVLVAPENPEAIVAAIADPATSVVTITVTEKGYHRRPETGGLIADSAEIAADLSGVRLRSIYGFIAAALARRCAEKASGLTLISCDNLSGNGQLLRALLMEFLNLRDPMLREWAERNVVCPNTMVDRLVPATTRADINRVEALTGLRDEALVVTESFRRWVIEDRFVGPRPRWEDGGAQLVENVTPFELAKLRLLNGSHSTLSYAGLALGLEFVHEAIADPDLARLVRLQMDEEAAPSLRPAASLDIASYSAAILERFANRELPYRLAQIAMDGSQKVPQRWLATISERAEQGKESPHHMLSLTAWIAYTRGRTPAGEAYELDDPLRDRFAALWREAGPDAQALVAALVGSTGIFPPAFRERPELVERLGAALRDWIEQGPRAALHRHLASRRETCPQA